MALALCAAVVTSGVVAVQAQAAVWNIGDVFAGVGNGAGSPNGSYNVYDNAANFKETISSTTPSTETTGCAFDSNGDLFGTHFGARAVVKFSGVDPHGVLQTIDAGAQGGGGTESVVFDAAGNFYVGNADGNHDVQMYDATGNFLRAFDVPVDARGTDWIDLAADQRTLFYNSEGRAVQRYDLAADAPLPNFAMLPGGGNAFALRILPPGDGSGGVLVADRNDIKRLDGAGNVVQTYDAPGEDSWFALNLDPNGTSFWSAGIGTNDFYRFNIATGNVEVGPINTMTTSSLAGLCVKGEPTAAVPEPLARPGGAAVPGRAADTGALELIVDRSRVQKGIDKGHVTLFGTCNRNCSAAARSTIDDLPNPQTRVARRIRFKRINRQLPGKVRKTFKIPISKAIGERLELAIERGKRPIIKVRVTATDGFGAVTKYRKVRVTQ